MNNTANHHLHSRGYPDGSDNKESACNAGDVTSIPVSGGSPGEGTGYPLQYPCLENAMDREAWQATVDRVTKSQTQLSPTRQETDFHFIDFYMVLFVSLLKTAGISSNEQHNSIMYKPSCPYRHKFILPLEICRFQS